MSTGLQEGGCFDKPAEASDYTGLLKIHRSHSSIGQLVLCVFRVKEPSTVRVRYKRTARMQSTTVSAIRRRQVASVFTTTRQRQT